MEKETVLKNIFGFSAFRMGQDALIDMVLSGRDSLGIMPTGAGKSICYQVPALMLDGITLVISPLISLMKNQVDALNQAGVKAAYLNSSLSYNQYMKALSNASNGQYKIIYVAPERLQSDEFSHAMRAAKISMVTIDEAHCVSQWGQDFRPSYLKIVDFIRGFSNRPIVTAFTATATAHVREDIIDKLQLNDPYVITTGFDRKNLYLSVQKPKDKFLALMDYVKNKEDRYGIVYCSTRKTVEEVYDKLNATGFTATRYHAGLSDLERRDNQDAFIYDKANIMVATNAFGMGIDKSNVSYVIHYNMPKNIESYYQEAGRAGRDGEAADCILFYSGQDVVINQFFIDNAIENDTMDEVTRKAIKEKDRQLLKRMTYYCHTQECLRKYILNYFGEEASHHCGNCSPCNTNYEEMNVASEAKAMIACIEQTRQRFGITLIVDALKGSKNKRVLSAKLDTLPVYGALSKLSESRIRDIFNHLVFMEALIITNGEYPVVKLGKKAVDVLEGTEEINMKVLAVEDTGVKTRQHSSNTVSKSEDKGLFEKLRSLRNKIASSQRMPAYIVFTDATLRDMCMRRPASKDAFLEVTGVGQAKLVKYGQAFIDEIRSFEGN